MYNPLVTIIIPVYNGSNYLKESIDSALTQTYKNIEIIVVNDGSTDEGATENIALSYGNKIRYFYKENGGVATALNLGIKNMKGEWFSWLSHDDLYMPSKIESQIKKIIQEDLEIDKTIISCGIVLIDSDGKRIKQYKKGKCGFFTGDQMFKNLFTGQNLNGCALLIPKTTLVRVGGFDSKYRFIQDWMCWVYLALEKNNFYVFEENGVMSRVHGSQQTKKIATVLPREVNDFLEKLLLQLSEDIFKNIYYIKTILFYATSINNEGLVSKYRSALIENNLCSIFDNVYYYFYYARGKVIWQIKKIYRTLMSAKYRKTDVK